MNDSTEIPHWGSVALVSYIPDPLRSFLGGLRQSLPHEDDAQPHITILPPRPLKLPVDNASQAAVKILQQFSAFPVQLSKLRVFPNTQVLYLDLSQGGPALYKLHGMLNRGDLRHAEKFDFRPHLTLGGPVSPTDLGSTVRDIEVAWRSFRHPAQFFLDEVVFLWLRPDGGQGKWSRLWSHQLSTKETIRARAATAFTTQTC